MFTRQHLKTRPLFLAADLVLVWLAFEASYATRSHLPFERAFYILPAGKFLLTVGAVVGWVLAGLLTRLYDSVLRGSWWGTLRAALRQGLIGSAFVVLFQYMQRADLSRPFLVLLFFYATAMLVAFRTLARAAAPSILGADTVRRHIWIAGTGAVARRVAQQIEQSERYGLELDGFFDARPGTVALSREYPVKEYAELAAVLQGRIVDEIVFAVEAERLAQLEDVLLMCEEEGIRTRLHVEVLGRLGGRVELEHLEGEPMLTFSGAPHDDVRLLMKRATDLVLSLFALAVLSPVLALIALLVKATSPGPVFFRQERCGLNGRRFQLYKFRTMVADAEARRCEVAHLNVKKTAFKIPNDPRVTWIGRWLRKFSLDELPQLWNIVRGEMAIVGPRPPVFEEVQKYERWQRRRLRMRPGLTCLWTLAGRDALDFEDWMRLDLKYIDEWSLGLDWAIIVRTVPQVVLGKGAH